MPPRTPEEIRERIGLRLRETMKAKRWRFTELAEASGVTRSHLYAIANGRTSPTSDTLTKIANALLVDPVVFLRPFRKPPT